MVLAMMQESSLSGYQIMKEIEERSMGFMVVKTGMLYPTLKKMEEDGYIASVWITDGRRKRVYSITEKGRSLYNDIEKTREILKKIHYELFDKLGINRESPAEFISFMAHFRMQNLSKMSRDEQIKKLRELEEKIDHHIKLLTSKKKAIARIIEKL